MFLTCCSNCSLCVRCCPSCFFLILLLILVILVIILQFKLSRPHQSVRQDFLVHTASHESSVEHVWLLNRSHFVDILCIFIHICMSIQRCCDASPKDPLTLLQALPGVVRPGAQQTSWSPTPSFSLILQGFYSPRVMRNRSGSDLEGVGACRADM